MTTTSPQYIGFTTAGAQHLSQIVIPIQIVRHHADHLAAGLKKLPTFKASIDLSQPNSRFSEAAIRQLAIPLTDTLDLYLPNQIRLANIAIQIAALPANLDCLLGLDFINTGDVSISSHDGKTVFSYRTPPQGGLDFVQQANHAQDRLPKQQKRRISMASRDQPCPCGSGKKHGNCCAKLH